MADKKEDIYNYEPLWGNWYIDMPIGKGSFGSVYKVSRKDMGHTYTSAVKIISVPTDDQFREAEATIGGDETALMDYFEDITKNIINEVNMLYTLSGNSNIISYQDHKLVKRDDRIGWDILIRMEYITTLKKYISLHQMNLREVISLGIDLCSALQICSKKGIIHRDIKDDNIFVNEEGVFKLGDFGIARELSKTGTGASMRGTPLYMAPEVYRGDKYDSQVDIYSLGIVLYKILNDGRVPFMPNFPTPIRFKDSEEALMRRMSGEVLAYPSNGGKLMGDVVLKACAFDVSSRYLGPDHMKEQLQNLYRVLSDEELNQPVTQQIKQSENPIKQDITIQTQTLSQVVKGEETELMAIKEMFQDRNPNENQSEKFSINEMANTKSKINSMGLNRIAVLTVVALFVIFGAVYLQQNSRKVIPSVSGSEVANNAPLSKDVVMISEQGLRQYIKEVLSITDRELTISDVQNVESLDLSSAGIFNLDGLQYFTGLKELNLSGNIIRDIHPLSGLTKLESIDLSNNLIIDLGPLKKLSNLEILKVRKNNINDISIISDLNNLITLDIANNQIEKIDGLGILKNLRSLNLGSNQISNFETISLLEELEELNVSSNKTDQLNWARKLLKLKSLNISNLPIKNLEAISELVNLAYLEASATQISDLFPIKDMKGLIKLDLSNNAISDITILSGLSKLKILNLGINRLTTLDELKDLRQINSLDVHRNEITSIMPLANLSNLTWLDASENFITDISPIAKNRFLDTLLLSHNTIISTEIITNFEGIKVLDLGDNQLSELDGLVNLEHLEELNIENNKIDDISVLHHFWKLEILIANNNIINDLSSLKNLTQLSHIELRNNQITNLDALKNQKNLEHLSLTNNQISDLEPLRSLSLVTLELAYNKISDADALKDMQKLTTLLLSHNVAKEFPPLQYILPRLKKSDFVD